MKENIVRVDDRGLVKGEVLTPEHAARIPGPEASTIRAALLTWFAAHGRSFPWRGSHPPWRVLLTEVLLRKTGATVVALYLPAFLERYPSPAAILAAGRDDLAAQFAPLGLRYQRTDQLLALAAVLIERHGGEVPESLDELLSLPAVGRYTAVATRAFGFGIPGGVVDTNVVRIASRMYRIRSARAEARKDPLFWGIADRLIGDTAAPELNWALLDLGALTCVAGEPSCAACPIRRGCLTGSHHPIGTLSFPD